jgi:hypothetical protein
MSDGTGSPTPRRFPASSGSNCPSSLKVAATPAGRRVSIRNADASTLFAAPCSAGQHAAQETAERQWHPMPPQHRIYAGFSLRDIARSILGVRDL